MPLLDGGSVGKGNCQAYPCTVYITYGHRPAHPHLLPYKHYKLVMGLQQVEVEVVALALAVLELMEPLL